MAHEMNPREKDNPEHVRRKGYGSHRVRRISLWAVFLCCLIILIVGAPVKVMTQSSMFGYDPKFPAGRETKRLGRIRLKVKPKPGAPPGRYVVGHSEAMHFDLRSITGLQLPDRDDPAVKAMEATGTIPVLAAAELPKIFDWREQKCVTPARSQGNCGSCWAFAAIGAFEGSWLKSLPPEQRKPEELNMSEQHVLNCTEGSDCGGGWHGDAMTLLSKGGTNNESDQPYTAQEQACQTGTMPYVAAGGTKFVDKANNIPTQQQIKTALIQHGPLAVCITATDALQGYAGGVFDEGSTATINHVVTLIGWNDDKQAWIIKNSWGPTWGEEAGGMQGQKGFAYISYTKGNNIGYAAAWIDAKQQNFAPNFLNNLRKMLPELTKPIAGTAMTLNPQAEVNLTLDANDTAARIALGSRFVVTLQEQPGTGYVYRVTQINTDMIKLVGTPILTSTPRPGGVQTKVFTFEAVKLGTSILEITNSGPGGEPGEPKWPQFRVAVHVERP